MLFELATSPSVLETSKPSGPPPKLFFPEHFSSGEGDVPRHPIGSVNFKAPPKGIEDTRWAENLVLLHKASKPPAVKGPPVGFEHHGRPIPKEAAEQYLDMVQRGIVKPAPKGPPANLKDVPFKACPVLSQIRTNDPKPGSKRERKPPLKGSIDDLQRKLFRKPTAKPPPGFPKGTSVPLGFTVTAPGTMAREIGQMAVAGPTQVILMSGAIPIVNATFPSSSTPEAAAAASYTQPSEVVVKRKCSICKELDSKSYPLKLCWYVDEDGKRCGKYFCYN
eukprot:769455-Amphidinium_carterae.2